MSNQKGNYIQDQITCIPIEIMCSSWHPSQPTQKGHLLQVRHKMFRAVQEKNGREISSWAIARYDDVDWSVVGLELKWDNCIAN
jgi:hypothetical protein